MLSRRRIRSVIQEGIVLFGVTLLLQIANYFKGKKVLLKIIIILIIIRMGYILCLEFGQYLIRFIDLTSFFRRTRKSGWLLFL